VRLLPLRYQGWNSPYYNESHQIYRKAVRDFVDAEIMPFAFEWDEAKAIPRELFQKTAKAGWLGACVGAPWRPEAGDKLIGGIKPEQFDVFHEMIGTEELSRVGSGGLAWGLFGGLSIGLPPVLLFGDQQLRERVVKPCLSGEKIICLAVTEPSAGSDVANLKCTAVKSACGKFYIVNGEKKCTKQQSMKHRADARQFSCDRTGRPASDRRFFFPISFVFLCFSR